MEDIMVLVGEMNGGSGGGCEGDVESGTIPT
jgi:hypothetical protein